MTRSEHLEWCKRRALEYVDARDCQQAMTSMFSDLRKHTDTANHPAIELGFGLMMAGLLSKADETRTFINGFN